MNQPKIYENKSKQDKDAEQNKRDAEYGSQTLQVLAFCSVILATTQLINVN